MFSVCCWLLLFVVVCSCSLFRAGCGSLPLVVLCAVVVMCCVLLYVVCGVARMMFAVRCRMPVVACLLLLFVGVVGLWLWLIARRCGSLLLLVVCCCLLFVIRFMLSFAVLFVVVRCSL